MPPEVQPHARLTPPSARENETATATAVLRTCIKIECLLVWGETLPFALLWLAPLPRQVVDGLLRSPALGGGYTTVCESLHAGGRIVLIGTQPGHPSAARESPPSGDVGANRGLDAAPDKKTTGNTSLSPLCDVAGDAAHSMIPSLGQGCNSALESAAALASVLREGAADAATAGGKADGSSLSADVPAALARFSAMRKPDTDAIQRMSTDMETIIGGKDGARARDRCSLIPAMAEAPWADQHASDCP